MSSTWRRSPDRMQDGRSGCRGKTQCHPRLRSRERTEFLGAWRTGVKQDRKLKAMVGRY